MKEMIKMVVVLVVISALAGLLLAWVNDLTTGPIATAMKAEEMTAIKTVLPGYDNTPNENVYNAQESGQEWVFFVARLAGEFSGAAFKTSSSGGYGGPIVLMVGVNNQGQVHAIEILDQKETPGLGAKIKEPEFKSQFSGKSISATRWSVRKDQGEIDQITAATISSRAVVNAIKVGLDIYTRHEVAIKNQGEQ